MIARITEFRKELHQHPEISGSEFHTAERIKSFLSSYPPTRLLENLGGTGIAAVYEFSSDGPTMAIRCELDALPILEENQFGHRSDNQGISHKCGHDGHMAIVAGLAPWIKEQTFKSGKLVLLFQPAEETGKGAPKVMEDSRFKELHIDYIFALHNIPGVPMHTVIVPKNGFSAEVQSFSLSFMGKECHASEPENGKNPALPIAEAITMLNELNLNESNRPDFKILTPIHIHMGDKSYGISPAKGELHYTIRTWNTETMDFLKGQIKTTASQLSEKYSIKHALDWFEYFPASINDAEGVDRVLNAAETNHLAIMEKDSPFAFGEDFGWFSKEYNATMFGLGAGENTPSLHHADYDFPDVLISTGMAMFKTLIAGVFNGV